MAHTFSEDNKGKYVEEIFNSLVVRYDLVNTLMTFGLDGHWRRFAAKISGLKIGGNGLDVCCGTGRLTMELARLAGPAGRVVGLDFSGPMLEKARQNVRGHRFRKNIVFIYGNAMNLPFTDHVFDCVTVGWGLRNVTDYTIALREMIRVVRRGGKVVSVDMGQPESPLMNKFYWHYFQKVIPAMGKLWAGNGDAYRYLYDSSRQFFSPSEQSAIFERNGLSEIRLHSRLFGAIRVIEGVKV